MPGYLPASICFFNSLPLGPPAISTNVGTQSRDEKISLKTVPGLMCPGQRITQGARMPPSQVLSLKPLKGVVLAPDRAPVPFEAIGSGMADALDDYFCVLVRRLQCRAGTAARVSVGLQEL